MKAAVAYIGMRVKVVPDSTPLELVCIKHGVHTLSNQLCFELKETVLANLFDENNSHPNKVHLMDKGYWWALDAFEIKR